MDIVSPWELESWGASSLNIWHAAYRVGVLMEPLTRRYSPDSGGTCDEAFVSLH